MGVLYVFNSLNCIKNLKLRFGQLSGSSGMNTHDIMRGRYTNLLFQSKQLGLVEKCLEIKRKYAKAKILLGDIPKVPPSSKVMGDLSQLMVY